MGQLTRLPDWRQRLIAYLSGVVSQPFEPGRHDCALFTAGAVAAMTGRDVAAEWRGRYRTLRGGQRVLRRAGHADHVALAASMLQELDNPFMAQAGDVAAVATPEGAALGIVQGAGIYVMGPRGFGVVPLTSIARAFRIPVGG